jgi:hypothetical protein
MNINEVVEMAVIHPATHFGRNFQKQFELAASGFIKVLID